VANRLFTWLSVMLGIENMRQELHGVHARLAAQVYEVHSMLESVQKDKLKFYVDKQKPDAKKLMQVMDYETSQIAALDEFKDEK
jgi:hypothetical protein